MVTWYRNGHCIIQHVVWIFFIWKTSVRIRWYEIQSRRLLFISVCCCGFLCWWCDDRCVRTDGVRWHVYTADDPVLRRLLFFSTCCCGGCYYYFLLVWTFLKETTWHLASSSSIPSSSWTKEDVTYTHTQVILFNERDFFCLSTLHLFFFHSTSNFEYSKFQTLIWLEKSFKIFIFLNSTRNFQYFKF